MKNNDDMEKRIENINEVLISMMALDFSKKAYIGDGTSTLDGIATAVNILGEELKSKLDDEKKKSAILEGINTQLREVEEQLKIKEQALLNSEKKIRFERERLYAALDSINAFAIIEDKRF